MDGKAKTAAVAAMQHQLDRRHREVNFNRTSERPLFPRRSSNVALYQKNNAGVNLKPAGEN
jgi:hypothetical protein